MSLDVSQLELVIAGGDAVARRQAERIMPIRKRGNLLLCVLLLGNAVVNSFLAILTASITSGVVGAVLSTAFILIFGEILPQSVCSRYGLSAGSKSVEIVRFFTLLLLPVAWPISKVLDAVLGGDLGTLYSRTELKMLFTMQAERAAADTQENADMGTIGKSEAAFLCGALSLSEKQAHQIMTRIADVFCVHADDLLDFALMRKIADSGHTRIPVVSTRALDDDSNTEAIRSDEVLGLLSTKDLILIDPEDRMPVGQLLKHCGRSVLTFWFDTPVAQLFRDFKHGRSHLGIIKRVNEDDERRDPFYEITGIVTLEDVLEELIQSEIVDEDDVYVDNVTMAPVGKLGRLAEEASRRNAWQNLLDPEQLHETKLQPADIKAISSFLAANVPAFSPGRMSANQLQALLDSSDVEVLEGSEGSSPLYERGRTCACCTVLLQGRMSIVCGSEGFEGERGAWSLLAVNALFDAGYIADFTATAVETTRVLKLTRDVYERVLRTVKAEIPADPVRNSGSERGSEADAALAQPSIGMVSRTPAATSLSEFSASSLPCPTAASRESVGADDRDVETV